MYFDALLHLIIYKRHCQAALFVHLCSVSIMNYLFGSIKYQPKILYLGIKGLENAHDPPMKNFSSTFPQKMEKPSSFPKENEKLYFLDGTVTFLILNKPYMLVRQM